MRISAVVFVKLFSGINPNKYGVDFFLSYYSITSLILPFLSVASYVVKFYHRNQNT